MRFFVPVHRIVHKDGTEITRRAGRAYLTQASAQQTLGTTQRAALAEVDAQGWLIVLPEFSLA
jgi:hypothetical protein